MKKILCSAVFLFILISLHAEQWYFSNSSGMILESADSEGWEQQEWILSEIRTGQDLIRTLYHFGQENRRWESVLQGDSVAEETVYREGVPESKLINNEQGQPGETVLYDRWGRVDVRQVYVYDGSGRISTVMFYDSAGNLLYEDRYALRPDGTLRRIVRFKDDEAMVAQSWISERAGTVTAVWIQRPDELQLVEKRSDGRIARIRTFAGGILQRRTQYSYNSGGVLESETIEEFQTGEKWVRIYSETSKILLERYYSNGLLVSLTRFTYNDSDVLMRRETTGRGMLEVVEYSYRQRTLEEERYYSDGVLSRIVTYLEDAVRTEELYRGGKPFLTLTYQDDVLTEKQWTESPFNVRNEE